MKYDLEDVRDFVWDSIWIPAMDSVSSSMTDSVGTYVQNYVVDPIRDSTWGAVHYFIWDYMREI